MTKELEKWHDEVFWPKYRKFIKTPYPTDWGAGGRGESEKKIMMLKPSAELRERIENALDGQTDHRQLLHDRLGSNKAYHDYTAKLAKCGESVYKNRQARTWIHNLGWKDDIPTIKLERQEIMKAGICKVQGCNNEVHGAAFSMCYDHMYPLNN